MEGSSLSGMSVSHSFSERLRAHEEEAERLEEPGVVDVCNKIVGSVCDRAIAHVIAAASTCTDQHTIKIQPDQIPAWTEEGCMKFHHLDKELLAIDDLWGKESWFSSGA